MADINYNQIVSLIWNIADDVLRDVFLRGQYRDVILPMVVLRRLDALLEPTKDEVLKELEQLGPNDEIDEGVMRDITKLSLNPFKYSIKFLQSKSLLPEA
jgi:type I restriction enzyme M protein